ncbi:hypothetical protein [Aquibacillus rhizosphaerae]|uniref:SPOR domain-containing protein n=1 Tax=Aquibacillus rhizosphaerae TaxID=3051431 RepID=A0ABT7L907_9BACI|nr:hypothetical protein [Aquibacillus sp. LR5S19]MDL4841670.1 hypothetical protein [Aquibacillus sp. LR5S19]
MDNRKTISVKMNGKETTIQSDKHSNKDPWPITFNEQAASLDNNFNPNDLKEYEKNHTIEDDWYNSNNYKKKGKKIPPIVKIFIISAGSAILVGLTLGFIMLRMFVGLENGGEQTDASSSVVVDDDGQATTEQGKASDASGNVTYKMADLEASVIQAGAFSTIEKAEEWQQGIRDSGYLSMIWEKDGEFRLFVGISNSQAVIEKIVADMDSVGVESYDRQWISSGQETQLLESEIEWLKTFPELWNNSLSLENLSASNWTDWLANYPKDSSEKVKALQTEANSFVEAIKNDESSNQKQIHLLNMWKLYSELSKE